MVGSSIGGALSDKFGRKNMVVKLNYAFCLVIVLHAASKTDFRVFALAHTLIGFISGLIGFIFIYQQELTVGRLRSIGSNVQSQLFSFGMLYMGILTYYFSDFTYICFMLTIPALVFNTAIAYWLKESPFWLQSKNRFIAYNIVSYFHYLSLSLSLSLQYFSPNNDNLYHRTGEVKEILKYIADMNTVKLDNQIQIKSFRLNNDNPSIAGGVSETVRSLFTSSKSTTAAMITLLFSWIAGSYCYWGLSFSVENIAGSMLLNQLVITLMDLCNRPINCIGVEKWERKTFIRICNASMIIVSVFGMIPWPYKKEIIFGFTIRKIAALAGRMIAELYMSTIYMYTSEVLPTVARASGLGICSCVARIGSIFSPFVIQANEVSPIINFSIILVLSLASFCLFSLMPETKGKN